jgi:membrane protein DedA with SNARE-associated domain
MKLLNLIISLAEDGKYIILFFVYLVEGPAAGFISAMLSAAGKLNIYIVAALFVIGEIGADLFYYYLGKSIPESKLQKKIAKYENKEFLTNVKIVLKRNPIKVLAFIKTIGVIAVPSLILIGKYQSLKPKKFILWTTIICLIKDLTILLSGYFLGLSTEAFLEGYGIYRVIGVVLTVIILVYLFLKLNKEKVEEITLKILKRI